MPNRSLHPPFSETYVLPRTKYGLPVTLDMFEDNSFVNDNEDHKSRWWEKVWAEEEARQRREQQERQARGLSLEIDRTQQYHATTDEELKGYIIWQQESEALEREQARERRLQRAAREAESIMEAPKRKRGERIIVKMELSPKRGTEERKRVTPWEFEDEVLEEVEDGIVTVMELDTHEHKYSAGDQDKMGTVTGMGDQEHRLMEWFKTVRK
ncbi:uncharacterized protein RAG0_15813 [Rhynchosporium agropyri]|uniref:Uncharacterized protein n=1 Tax=Rhynchosporium agropyri TaxID=914238 RepID=A0A1E1LMM8_9HELO|nr:uncharacterized protein RAG0_15813 [Rhynchosporium agropyri]